MKIDNGICFLLEAQKKTAETKLNILDINHEIGNIKEVAFIFEPENSKDIKENISIIEDTLHTINKALGLLDCELCDLYEMLKRTRTTIKIWAAT